MVAEYSHSEFVGAAYHVARVSALDATHHFLSHELLAAGRRDGAKRALDFIGAVGAAILFAPVMLIVAVAILITEGRPVLIAHRRIGLGGRIFGCYKFRSMRRDAQAALDHLLATDPQARAEWLENRKLRDDPRVTRLGRHLRRTSLDELPQIFNVLRGEMSLVGPRPIVLDEAVKYGGNIVDYLTTRPGLTGMWQISGRSDTSYRERVELDVGYARRRTLLQDCRILIKSVVVVLTARGSC